MSMFKKTARLTKRQFDEHFTHGKRFHFPHCTIVYSQYPSLHASVVVSKKVAKQAVKRNTIRRRVYAVLYNKLKQNNQTGVFIVLMKPTATTLSRAVASETINKNIATVLKKT